MELETFVLIIFLVILLEYNLRLRGQIEKKANEKFLKMKAEYLESMNKKTETQE
jgi:hypothetical protein